MIDGLFNSGSMPVLEKLLAFTDARHKLLTENIANLNTPNYLPADMDPRKFQAALRKAIEQRRRGDSPHHGPLNIDKDALRSETRNQNILFHDRNNRDLERIMQDLAENTLAHRTGIELLKNQFEMLKIAIRERV
ncbi:MAG: flagellar basal body rod protein FlgB [Phycisphaeraceae bacterium]|nr:flagellar basal body rod protein FlgB [Phycisphaeraceae bacterium]